MESIWGYFFCWLQTSEICEYWDTCLLFSLFYLAVFALTVLFPGVWLRLFKKKYLFICELMTCVSNWRRRILNVWFVRRRPCADDVTLKFKNFSLSHYPPPPFPLYPLPFLSLYPFSLPPLSLPPFSLTPPPPSVSLYTLCLPHFSFVCRLDQSVLS